MTMTANEAHNAATTQEVKWVLSIVGPPLVIFAIIGICVYLGLSVHASFPRFLAPIRWSVSVWGRLLEIIRSLFQRASTDNDIPLDEITQRRVKGRHGVDAGNLPAIDISGVSEVPEPLDRHIV